MAVVRFGELFPAGVRMQDLFTANHTEFTFQIGSLPGLNDRASLQYTAGIPTGSINAAYLGAWNGGTALDFYFFRTGAVADPTFIWDNSFEASGSSIPTANETATMLKDGLLSPVVGAQLLDHRVKRGERE